MATATPSIGTTRISAGGLRDFGKGLGLAALVWVLYGNSLADLARDWWNVPAWSQGILLPPIAVYIAWMRRRKTLACAAGADQRGLFLAGFASFLFLLGRLTSEFFLTRISFVFMLAALIWIFWGLPRLQTLVFPLLLLAAMVPLPAIVYNSLASPLQLFASDVATMLAQAAGVVAHREGNIIELAGTSLGVAEACSGLNSLSALIVGSLLLGYTSCSRPLPRALLVGFSIPLAIAINVIRVAATAILADYDQAFAMGFYHLFSGWLVFVAGFLSLCGLARLMQTCFKPSV